MSYYTGSVCAVPQSNRQAYIDHANRSWPHFAKRGALRMVETWGAAVAAGTQTDFLRATQAKDDETVVFSWIEWPDRETSDKAWADIMADESVGADMGGMPYDGQRMFWGSFAPVFEAGSDDGAGWYQGFLVPVPPENRDAYAAMAREAWEGMFKDAGALSVHECWGEDVPHGKVTDMYRAVDAKDGEAVVFAWMAWPDRATCEAAAKAMEADMEGQPMPEMPFDGKRMIWAGFEPIVDLRA